MCFGDLQKNTVIVGITAIVCSIIFLILGFPNDDLRHYLSYDVAPIGHTITIFVMWILIGLAAAALLVGAFFARESLHCARMARRSFRVRSRFDRFLHHIGNGSSHRLFCYYKLSKTFPQHRPFCDLDLGATGILSEPLRLYTVL
ncbi:uncharacterized protein LOC108161661 isoform X2 [Drosophila miranda]|uniref:uncharacterized protein LOC108161661 isoform X2 n=1 Tax=Drosophila miranda TaxID=7229 RepID=UPI00143F6CDA|nr:uncharacterized protein LOC108161661 isoform X2 [Drosophila miranda]